jgi:hypothetical protein
MLDAFLIGIGSSTASLETTASIFLSALLFLLVFLFVAIAIIAFTLLSDFLMIKFG